MMNNKILVTLDGTQFSESVLEHVVELAKATESQVVLLTVLPEPKPEVVDGRVIATLDEVVVRLQAEANDYLRVIATRLQPYGIKTTCVVRFGRPVKEIADYARRQDINFIAMATHNRSGLDRLLHPSVSKDVMHSVAKPMLLFAA